MTVIGAVNPPDSINVHLQRPSPSRVVDLA